MEPCHNANMATWMAFIAGEIQSICIEAPKGNELTLSLAHLHPGFHHEGKFISSCLVYAMTLFTHQYSQVIIVGAGPCGLLLAVLLSKQGVQVQVLEASTELDDQPRACHYSAPAKFELERAGVLDSISAEGFFPRSVCWRKNDGSHIVGLNHEIEPESSVHRMVALELGRVVQILYNAAAEQEGTEVLMGHRVTAVGQDDLSAWVEVALPSGQSDQFSADYIIGCDGASSQVRRSLFGDFEFPGWTWEQQIIATNVSPNPGPMELERSVARKPSDRHDRCIMTLPNSVMRTPTSLSTRRTGTWQQRSQRTTSGESRMGMCLG